VARQQFLAFSLRYRRVILQGFLRVRPEMSGAQGVLLSPQRGCASPMPPIASALTLQLPHHAAGIRRACQALAKVHGAAGVGVCSRDNSSGAAGWLHAAIQRTATRAWCSEVISGQFVNPQL
jgi:hypothetical protein